MAHMKIANFGPFVLSHLQCALQQMLIISRAECKECLILMLQRSIN